MKTTNMFIFRPHELSYCRCSGIIIVIANTFKQAVQLAKNCTTDNSIFLQNSKDFRESSQDQWLLTEKFKILNNENPRIVVSNWNYS